MTTTHSLTARRLSLSYGHRQVLSGVDVDILPGAVTAVIGGNGCGTSTLLRTLTRLLRPTTGQVLLDALPLTDLPARQVARTLGLLPQSPTAPDGITVADLVGRGRTPHQGIFGQWSTHDHEIVARALSATGIADLAERSIDELSGGQRRRVWIAMALAQDTDILLLDEPTTFLGLLRDLNTARGTTIVMVLHDLNLAARYCDRLIALRDGRVAVAGTPDQVVTPAIIREVFDLESHVMPDPVSGAPMVMPIGRHRVLHRTES